jgi:GDPmannose 4,6-dehydratase
VQPNEIYNLSGQSSVALSFEQPVETLESVIIGTLNILEAIRFLNINCKFYNAGSSECFGNSDCPVDEHSNFIPKSPYGIAKATAFWEVANYRESYNIFATTGILFNHESPLRHERYVTKKIISTIHAISKGEIEKLELGNLNVSRDWGWAPEYVEAMWLMLQTDVPDDFIIATGTTISLEYFVKSTFDCFNLNWENYLELDEKLLRPNDIIIGKANPTKAKNILKWEAKIKADLLIEKLVSCEVKNLYF